MDSHLEIKMISASDRDNSSAYDGSFPYQRQPGVQNEKRPCVIRRTPSNERTRKSSILSGTREGNETSEARECPIFAGSVYPVRALAEIKLGDTLSTKRIDDETLRQKSRSEMKSVRCKVSISVYLKEQAGG